MEKNKNLTPIIVVVAVLVIAGGYFAWQRYQRDRVIKQYMGGLGNVLSEQNIGDLAKFAEEAARQEAVREETEKEKSPSQIYGETEEIKVVNELVAKANSEIKPMLAEIFGGAKLTQYFSNIAGIGEDSGSVVFTLKRNFESKDANYLNEALTNNGYKIISSGQSGDSVTVMASKGVSQYTFSADIGDNEITAVILNIPYFGETYE